MVSLFIFRLLLIDSLFFSVVAPFLGKPYVASTLDRQLTEELVVNLNEVDCTTFVEYLAASLLIRKRADSLDHVYRSTVESLRYRDGIRNGYASRLHYFSEWIENNQKKGLLLDVTSSFRHEPLRKKINFMSTHSDSYRQLRGNSALLDSIRWVEKYLSTQTYSYIPKEYVKQELGKIRAGDIIAITTDIVGLDISHVGFAYAQNGTIYLLHASSLLKKVVIDSLPLDEYLLRNKRSSGIRVIRLNTLGITPG